MKTVLSNRLEEWYSSADGLEYLSGVLNNPLFRKAMDIVRLRCEPSFNEFTQLAATRTGADMVTHLALSHATQYGMSRVLENLQSLAQPRQDAADQEKRRKQANEQGAFEHVDADAVFNTPHL